MLTIVHRGKIKDLPHEIVTPFTLSSSQCHPLRMSRILASGGDVEALPKQTIYNQYTCQLK